MKNIILLILLTLISFSNLNSQSIKKQSSEIVLVQGVPTCPNDSKITELINKVGVDNLLKPKKNMTKTETNLCREVGVLLNKKELYDAADWYLERSKNYVEVVELEPEVVFENPKDEIPEISAAAASSLAKDKEFLNNLPKSYDDISPSDMKKLANEIESKLQKLIKEKEELIKKGESKDIIDAKDATINTLGKEKKIIGLNIKNVWLSSKSGIQPRIQSYLNSYSSGEECSNFNSGILTQSQETYSEYNSNISYSYTYSTDINNQPSGDFYKITVSRSDTAPVHSAVTYSIAHFDEIVQSTKQSTRGSFSNKVDIISKTGVTMDDMLDAAFARVIKPNGSDIYVNEFTYSYSPQANSLNFQLGYSYSNYKEMGEYLL
jgi:arsenate reductase-like glutaredoxin family protein